MPIAIPIYWGAAAIGGFLVGRADKDKALLKAAIDAAAAAAAAAKKG